MKQTKNLPLTLNIVTALLLAATAFFIYLHAAAHTDLSLTLAITFATTTYEKPCRSHPLLVPAPPLRAKALPHSPRQNLEKQTPHLLP